MFERLMHICKQVLTRQTGGYVPRQKVGAIQLEGVLKDLIIMKKFYKEHKIDTLLTQYVFPMFVSPHVYVRVKACWVLHCFANVHFKNDQLLIEVVRLTVNALLNDAELPVKVEAAIALQMLVTSQVKVHEYLEPQVSAVTLELLTVIRETKNYNITSVLNKMVPLYTEQLMPMAFEITDHLATTFSYMINPDSGTDRQYISATGLLDTMETVINEMKDNPDTMAQLEKTVIRVVVHVLQLNLTEYIEKAMVLLGNITDNTISEEMWKFLELLYQFFEKGCNYYFTDIMPVLSNYITVDTDAFLSNENRIFYMYKMIKTILNSYWEAESSIDAAKLLEIMVLKCSGNIDDYLPAIVKLVLERFTWQIKHSELRTMLLQVLIAILYCDPHLLFTILNKLQESSVEYACITQRFIKRWIHATKFFMGIHDRKLYVLGICTLLEMGPQRPNIEEIVPKLLPSCLMLFDGLKRAYEAKAEEDDDSSDEEDFDDNDEDVLSTKDNLEEMNDEHLENLAWMAVKNYGIYKPSIIEDNEDSNSIHDDDDYELDDTVIECYTTRLEETDFPVDEYIKFKDTLGALSTTEPVFYHALTSVLNEKQQEQLSAIFEIADQHKAQHIEKSDTPSPVQIQL